MAKVLKLLAVISAAALVISSFSACSISFGGNESTTAENVTTTTEAPTEEPTEEETTTAPQTTARPEKQDNIEDIFSDIKVLPVGTAGSSAKAASLALRLIAFSNSSLAEKDSLSDDIKALTDSIGEDGIDNYGESLYQINRYAKKFFSGNREDVVETAGQNDFPINNDYSQEKYEKIYDLLNIA